MDVATFALLQLADGTFPAGGFAHSGGLEAAVQLGEVASLASLRAFLEAAIRQVGRGALPFVSAAHARAADWRAIDARCELFLRNHVQNRASRDQGHALLAAASRAFGAVAPLHAEARRLRSESGFATHLAPTYGVVFGAIGLSRAATQASFLHGALRGLLSAAVRLGAIGPLEAQRQHGELVPLLGEVAGACGGLELDDVAQTAPLQDVLGGVQDRLYTRLFQS
jgi:urease accessory protein